jgi:hypothetical protein
VPDQTALGEDEGTFGNRQGTENASHNLFGMTEPVHRSRIYPVDAQFEGVAQRAF